MNQDDFKKLLDEALESIKQKQDSHSAALISIEGKLDAYGDMYKINDSNVRKVEKRLETLEDKANITPPPELTLADVV